MTTTGIIRQIDDLGRVVIPKGIRRTLHIHDGDPMEIMVNNGLIILSKYRPDKCMTCQLSRIREAVKDLLDFPCEDINAKLNKVGALLDEIKALLEENDEHL